MICPKCNSSEIFVSMEEVGSKTKKTTIGLGGRINNTARFITAVGTLGMSNLVWKKATGEETTKIKAGVFAVCQECGHHWKVK